MNIQSINSTYTSPKHDNYSGTRTSFKRKWPEHISWGANYSPISKTTNFKLFAFPDAKAVFVEIVDNISKNIGKLKERVAMYTGIPLVALTLTDTQQKDKNSNMFYMQHSGNGVFEAKGLNVPPGTEYRYVVVTNDNKINTVKDPYSKHQEEIHGWSRVYTPDNYEWENTAWLEGRDPRRITRKPGEPLRGLESLVIEEVNIPTLSKEGDFESAKAHIDKIAERGIANAVEIMPVENTFSLQWGYDGVDKFAVNEKLGGAVGLKRLVDYIHGKGLNVIMDMVPNHIGPDGDYLALTGPYESGNNDFGSSINYESENNRYVRDYMTNAALWWVNEFKVDGLRLDMTKFCESDFLLKQIVTEVNEHNPEVFLIAEDGRDAKVNLTRYSDIEISHEDELYYIDRDVDEIAREIRHNSPHAVGFDSEWDFVLMNALKPAVIESSPNMLNQLNKGIWDSAFRVKFAMSHDEIGNMDGTRLIPKVIASNLALKTRIDIYDPAKNGQAVARISQQIAELVTSDEFVDMTDEQIFDLEKSWGIRENALIPKQDLINAMNTGIAKQKLAQGTVLTIPGPKMYFQGDDVADLSYFKFFREFSDDKEKRSTPEGVQKEIDFYNKGYDILESVTRPECIVGTVKKSGMYRDLTQQMLKFNQDLLSLVKATPALLSGQLVGTFNDFVHNVHIHHLKQGDSEILVIKNFGQGFHDKTYGYSGFPTEGVWQEVFNSDAPEYGGADFSNPDRNDITSSNQNLSLSANSFIILKRIK